jgi:hypothetical protein
MSNPPDGWPYLFTFIFLIIPSGTLTGSGKRRRLVASFATNNNYYFYHLAIIICCG